MAPGEERIPGVSLSSLERLEGLDPSGEWYKPFTVSGTYRGLDGEQYSVRNDWLEGPALDEPPAE